MYKGIIFDFDGLIIDTETPQYEAYNEYFGKFNAELPISRWLQEVGTDSDFDSLSYLKETYGIIVDEIEAKTEIKENIRNKIKNKTLRGGVREYLETAQSLGYSIGLASSSNYKWVVHFLQKFDIQKYFETIKTSDHVKKVKPNPELYMKASEALNLEPKECIVFEDSFNGMTAAKTAGMTCVLVPNELTVHSTFENYDYMIKSMKDIKLEDLIKMLNKRKDENEIFI